MGLIDMNHSQKNQLIGFIIGILANAIGILAYILIFSKNSIALTLQDAYYRGYLGKLIMLGALLDLAVFFFFINRYENERARGVLIASCVLAFIILLLQFT
ncbi:hypothetical protein [Capnocytophaga sputigena]|jgi:membrane protein|uniref:hypothetical protein n=1 Tax=Capnocytophaga sputigena TaxID=1019 RepID=UPI002889A2E4|nr:hypothetical protein [Capnocytophaga sputigena]